MVKTLASQARNGGSIPLARSVCRRYQACVGAAVRAADEVVTVAVNAKPHPQEYSARSSGRRRGGRAALRRP